MILSPLFIFFSTTLSSFRSSLIISFFFLFFLLSSLLHLSCLSFFISYLCFLLNCVFLSPSLFPFLLHFAHSVSMVNKELFVDGRFLAALLRYRAPLRFVSLISSVASFQLIIVHSSLLLCSCGVVNNHVRAL